MSEAAASSTAPFAGSSQSHPSKKEGWPQVPAFSATAPCFRSAAFAVDAVGGEKWRLREGYVTLKMRAFSKPCLAWSDSTRQWPRRLKSNQAPAPHQVGCFPWHEAIVGSRRRNGDAVG
eukprot:symbB.v1.2.013689.t1/scaffold971.1/size148033/17